MEGVLIWLMIVYWVPERLLGTLASLGLFHPAIYILLHKEHELKQKHLELYAFPSTQCKENTAIVFFFYYTNILLRRALL